MSAALSTDTSVVKLGNAMMGVPDGQTDIEGDVPAKKVGNVSQDRLRNLVSRIEKLEEEKKALADDIKDLYAESRSAGFDVKVLRRLIAERRKEPAEIDEAEALLHTYRLALGD